MKNDFLCLPKGVIDGECHVVKAGAVIDHFSARSQLVPAYLDARKWSKQQAVLVAAHVYLTDVFTQFLSIEHRTKECHLLILRHQFNISQVNRISVNKAFPHDCCDGTNTKS